MVEGAEGVEGAGREVAARGAGVGGPVQAARGASEAAELRGRVEGAVEEGEGAVEEGEGAMEEAHVPLLCSWVAKESGGPGWLYMELPNLGYTPTTLGVRMCSGSSWVEAAARGRAEGAARGASEVSELRGRVEGAARGASEVSELRGRVEGAARGPSECRGAVDAAARGAASGEVGVESWVGEEGLLGESEKASSSCSSTGSRTANL